MPASARGIFLGLLASAVPLFADADPLPASVRSCIGEADAALRLACYDREVARLIAPGGTFAPTTGGAAAPAVAPAPAAAPDASTRHRSAKVSAVHQAGDDLVVTLEDGGVWEQAAPASGQLNLRPGDVVQLDRELGGWFLSNRYGESIQVRLRPPKS